MTGFNDILDDALPYMAVEFIEATAGTTWPIPYEVTDGAGAPVDLTSGYTATFSITTEAGTLVLALTVTFPGTGQIRATATPTATAAIPPGRYNHELTVTRTSDGAKAVLVGAGDSKFTVKKKAS